MLYGAIRLYCTSSQCKVSENRPSRKEKEKIDVDYFRPVIDTFPKRVTAIISHIEEGIMRRTVDQYPADIVLAPSGCPLTDLEYADDVVIFAESSTKLQHVVNLVSKLAAAYGLRLNLDKWKQMWISSRPRTGIRVDRQPIELVDEFCYLCCTLRNNGRLRERCSAKMR
ncbi:hypothetical protein RB195_020486 [Necator americanus]|uniref:Reverse transcriptase domain-containing protein n=1 Tax=Necator americanus TaxID=51031 RepID=A0ABR1CJ18_NECAM